MGVDGATCMRAGLGAAPTAVERGAETAHCRGEVPQRGVGLGGGAPPRGSRQCVVQVAASVSHAGVYRRGCWRWWGGDDSRSQRCSGGRVGRLSPHATSSTPPGPRAQPHVPRYSPDGYAYSAFLRLRNQCAITRSLLPDPVWTHVASGRGRLPRRAYALPRATGPESLNGGEANGEEIGIAGGRC